MLISTPQDNMCSKCGEYPKAINYVRDGKTFYRSICNKCLAINKKNRRKENKEFKNYKKKQSCEMCNFVAKYPSQLVPIKIKDQLRTVCLNCQVVCQMQPKIERLKAVPDN